jgi:hypothetical protein
MPRDAFLLLAALSFALAVALIVYGAWTWIIQYNGDVYYHWAGAAAAAGVVFPVIGLLRRRPRA